MDKVMAVIYVLASNMIFDIRLFIIIYVYYVFFINPMLYFIVSNTKQRDNGDIQGMASLLFGILTKYQTMG